MPSKKKLQFEIITAAPGNYKYAQEHGGMAPAVFTDAQLNKFMEYVKTVAAAKSEDEYQLYLCIHGPYSYALASQLRVIAAAMQDMADVYFEYSMHSRDLPEHWDATLDAARSVSVPFSVRIHTTLPDDDVTSASSEAFAIKRALARGVATTLDIYISADNCDRVIDMFDKFKSFHSQYSNVSCKFRVVESETGQTEFNEELLRVELEAIAAQLAADEALKNAFTFHINPARKERAWDDSLMSSIELVLCADGDGDVVVFPGYDVEFMTASAYEAFPLGSIDEDIMELEARRATLVQQLDEFGNGNTGDCLDLTRSVPWDDDDHEYSIEPSETLCRLDSIFREYLPHKTIAGSVND